MSSVSSTGGEIMIDRLEAAGVRHIFTVPGESFIAALDALHDRRAITPITCRNESGAAMMASATGQLTGRPGVAMVTRAPGAANALAGVYVAAEGACPMLLIVGLPPRSMTGRPAFQAIDLCRVFAPVTRWCAIVPSAADVADYLDRALELACGPTSGPVVLGVPEDVFSELAQPVETPAREASTVQPDVDSVAVIGSALSNAERPILLVGGSAWSQDAAAALAAFASAHDLPVVAAFRRQDVIDNRHDCYVGHAGLTVDVGLARALRSADCVVAIGDCLDDVTTKGFTLFDGREPGQRLIAISRSTSAISKLYPRAEVLNTCPKDAVEALARMDRFPRPPPWKIWRRDLRATYVRSLGPTGGSATLSLARAIADLSTELPDTAIVTNGAGNYAAFLHRHFTYKSFASQLAPQSGSMGFGLPAAIAAKLEYPDRAVVALAGDGCFQMTMMELATAVQFALPMIVIIANNSSLGTIRMHQDMRYPGRVVATSLANPDFCALAASFGAAAFRVRSNAEFSAVLADALKLTAAECRPAVIELVLEDDDIAPGMTN